MTRPARVREEAWRTTRPRSLLLESALGAASRIALKLHSISTARRQLQALVRRHGHQASPSSWLDKGTRPPSLDAANPTQTTQLPSGHQRSGNDPRKNTCMEGSCADGLTTRLTHPCRSPQGGPVRSRKSSGRGLTNQSYGSAASSVARLARCCSRTRKPSGQSRPTRPGRVAMRNEPSLSSSTTRMGTGRLPGNAPPNGARSSCGALKKKGSFHILRAPPASSAG